MKSSESELKARRYILLRARMLTSSMTIRSLARSIGVSTTHINDILSGRRFPRTDICYDILKVLEVPPNEIYNYFPPAGITPKDVVQREIEPEPRQMVLHVSGEITVTVDEAKHKK